MDENTIMNDFTNTFLRDEDTSNSNYQSLKHYLNEKKVTLLSFRNYLKKIVEGIDKGEFNIKMLNELTDVINKYYKKYDSDADSEDSSSEKAEASSKTSSISLEKLDDSEDLPSVDKLLAKKVSFVEEEDEKKEDTEKKININKEEGTVRIQSDSLLNAFMNSNNNLKPPMLINPSYDILNNINTFIKNSLVY